MESSLSKVEVMKQAIKEVMEEVGGGTNSSSVVGGDVEDNKHHLLLSKLMSQLEKLEAEPEVNTEELVDDEKTKTKIKKEDEEEKVVKEIKKVKRQNFITHCLLSAMIVLTVAWQISEVSLILRVKDGVNHPFRSIGNICKWMIKPPNANGDEEETDSSITHNLIESSGISDLKLPELLPRVELPKKRLGFSFLKDE